MKKTLFIAILFFTLLLGITANAATPNYATEITETSSIESDFKAMGKDLSSYKATLPASGLDYFEEGNRFELVDFQVAKLNEEDAIIYLYVYDPMQYNRDTNDYIETFWVSFDIEEYDFPNDYDRNNNWSKQLEYSSTHGIWKLKGYKFKYSDFNRITITSILGAMAFIEHRIQCFPNMTKEIVFKESLLPIQPSTPAEEITAKSSIKDDFALMGMDIEDYYVSKNFDYSKWYVVAVSFEVLEEGKAQSYFYLYNPKKTSASAFEISYKLNSSSDTDYFWQVKMDTEHSLYKIKGVTFNYSPGLPYKLRIQNIMAGEVYSESEFEITATFSLNDSEVSIQSNFDSTIIIDEYTVVEVEVKQDDKFINNWNSFWSGKEVSVLAYFYNFNFPDHIKYDEVVYAKFQYDYLTYHEVHRLTFVESKELVKTEKVVSEYTPDSKTIRVNEHSQELTFPTFYLGNRIKDKQFGTLKISGEASTQFDYDCSVLLDTTQKVRTDHEWTIIGADIRTKLDYTTLDKIELIELHYKNDGVVYKCQVITQPVDNEDIIKGEATSEKPWYLRAWELLIKFGGLVLSSIGLGFLPDVVKGIIGIIASLVVIRILIIVLKGLGKFIKKLFSK